MQSIMLRNDPAVLTLNTKQNRDEKYFQTYSVKFNICPKRHEVTGDRRKLHNVELHNLYSSPNIIRMIKLNRLQRFLASWPLWIRRFGPLVADFPFFPVLFLAWRSVTWPPSSPSLSLFLQQFLTACTRSLFSGKPSREVVGLPPLPNSIFGHFV
jgi:hypothetical protein